MSTIAYAEFTTRRYQAAPNTSTKQSPPGVSTYVDAIAALVPSEVLALHAVILSVTTTTINTTTTITAPQTLEWSFFGLLIVSALLYIVPRLVAKTWEKPDYIRMLIPPLSFLGWTMLLRPTAFDALLSNFASAPRTVIALFLAVILGIVASALGYQADQKVPKPAQP